jgi:nucleoside-diphosphate-sugar epimerase
MSTVLVTGGSGFIGSHVIVALLNAGHQVRTTVRSLAREGDVREMVRAGGVDAGDRLSFHAADLVTDAGWKGAIEGCDYVQHVASPLPTEAPEHEDDLIIPAREGTLRVLRFARDASVKRVVVTSSFAAVGYGHPPTTRPFDESNWSNVDFRGAGAYMKSKTLAERAAWDFVAREGSGLELSVINPTGVFGPVLHKDFAGSIGLLKRMLDGGMPAVPKLLFGVVDVRDVADLHVRAMTDAAAKGERFIAVSGAFLRLSEIARLMKDGLGPLGRRIGTAELPNWVVRIAASWNSQVRNFVPELGKPRNATAAKAIRLLGWNPRPAQETLVATGQSLARLGLLRE